ncbi:SOS response-associated peptidase [Absicoccus intestinalis]|uniref:Abasic site processing protein n=1 Tax=Absicoccus intestinalis TaxID=2926319 RepID=A0ABU4WKC2_9FIRM|nr:SOS response-associated peptidase family protein [Absicoccus sp. CLA-KB-P134]MDX8417007.1 SOS response-associated peptidase [Absicoccus sp. CLA-KB-P134]
MCGCYYLSKEGKANLERRFSFIGLHTKTGDIFPGQQALIIKPQGNELVCMPWHWGKDRIINARKETIFTKPMFKEAILHHRCVIPADAFYEWDALKQKVKFDSDKMLYLAGICIQDDFVIITQDANEVVKPIHDRMPVLVNNLSIWFSDDFRTIFSSQSVALQSHQAYYQERLF